MSRRFDWDPAKAKSNLRDHGVSFEKAQTVFADPFACIFDDEAHSEKEEREIIIGFSAKGRLLFVAFASTGNEDRLISARKATRRERMDNESNS